MANDYLIILKAVGMGMELFKSVTLKEENREDAGCAGEKKEKRLGK